MDSDNLVDDSKDDEQVAGGMSEKSNSKNEVNKRFIFVIFFLFL